MTQDVKYLDSLRVDRILLAVNCVNEFQESLGKKESNELDLQLVELCGTAKANLMAIFRSVQDSYAVEW